MSTTQLALALKLGLFLLARASALALALALGGNVAWTLQLPIAGEGRCGAAPHQNGGKTRMATMDFNLELQTAICGGSGETKLWRAVLEEALRTDPPGKVREWLSSEDGRLVVSLAGVDPDWVSEQIVPIMHPSAGGRRYAGRYSRRRSGKPLGRHAQSRAALTH